MTSTNLEKELDREIDRLLNKILGPGGGDSDGVSLNDLLRSSAVIRLKDEGTERVLAVRFSWADVTRGRLYIEGEVSLGKKGHRLAAIELAGTEGKYYAIISTPRGDNGQLVDANFYL